MQQHLALLAVMIVFCFGCQTESSAPAAFQHYCGACHLAPSPQELPRSIWEKNILPDMGARLGVKTPGFDPMAGKPQGEVFIYKQLGIYPEKQLISDEQWMAIRDYILANAPDTLPRPGFPELQTARLFDAVPLSLDSLNRALVTSLSFQEGILFAATVFGQVYSYEPASRSFSKVAKIENPVSAVFKSGESLTITSIGQMHPTDLFYGEVWSHENGQLTKIAGGLQRPVYTLVEDMGRDGAEALFVCEFGNLSGKLSMFFRKDGKFEKQVLLPLPGAIKVFPADMDQDGAKDLVVLTAQAQEGVWILYQKEGLVFKPEKVVSLSSVYGASGFELFDYNGDGALDIAIVNGDNADLSVTPKPYHGLRLFLNDGKNHFEEQLFFPINGATNVVARDFDQDGDVDFVVAAFFPDSENAPGRSLLYLENRNAGQYDFEAQVVGGSASGRWLVLTAGDFDRDGDEDVAVGAFTYAPENATGRFGSLGEPSPDILLLENKL